MSACAICGAPAPRPFRPPPAELAPDLDLRPGEPARGTLRRWVAVCRQCGAAGPDLSRIDPGKASIVQTPVYRATASPFLRAAMLAEGAARAELLLQAAWKADDAGVDAAPLRREAAAAFLALKPDERGTLRVIDILRRMEDFIGAQALAATLSPAGEDNAQVLAFQIQRIAARDAGGYLLSNALRPPASRPHVTYGAARTGGFWRRLLSR